MNTLESSDTFAWLLSYVPSRVSNLPLYEDQAPDQQPPPFLIAKLNRDRPLYSAFSYRFWSEETWLIYAVTYGTEATTSRTYADQLSAALERLASIPTPGGGQIVGTQRQGQYRRVEQEPGGTNFYRERGAFFKIFNAHP